MKNVLFFGLIILSLFVIGCAQKIDGDFTETSNNSATRIDWSTMSSSGAITRYSLASSGLFSQLRIRKYNSVLHLLDNKFSEEQTIENPKIGTITRQNGIIVSIIVEGKTYRK